MIMCVVYTKQIRRIIFLYQQKIIVRLYSIFYYIQQFFEHLYDDKNSYMNSITFISLPHKIILHVIEGDECCVNGWAREHWKWFFTCATTYFLSFFTHTFIALLASPHCICNLYRTLVLSRADIKYFLLLSQKVVLFLSYQSIECNNKEPLSIKSIYISYGF